MSSNLTTQCAIRQPLGLSEPFSFYLPYSTSQACDIYGPLCQTGSITVEVSLTDCARSMTTMPCSSYLSSQSSYLKAFAFDALYVKETQPHLSVVLPPEGWVSGFGRSPQCSSYRDAYIQSLLPSLKTCDGVRPFAPLNGTSAFAQLPPGFQPSHDFKSTKLSQGCCGKCQFKVNRVRVLYFPDPKATLHCASLNRRIGSVGVSGSLGTLVDFPLHSGNESRVYQSTTLFRGQTL